jgi:hypothetical protein
VLFKENERNDIHKQYERKESGEKKKKRNIFPKTKAVRSSEDYPRKVKKQKRKRERK